MSTGLGVLTHSSEKHGDPCGRSPRAKLGSWVRWQPYLARAMGVVLAGIGLGWTFWSVQEGGVMIRADEWVLAWMGARQSQSLDAVMRIVSAVATFPAIAMQVLVIGVLFARRARWRLLAGLLIAVVVGPSLNWITKLETKRERPAVEVAVRAPTDYSFPSGHTAAATLLYGFVAVLGFRRHKSGKKGLIVVVGCIGVIVLVGFSRVYLRLHFVSDVVGGLAIGCAWLPGAITLGELVGAAIDRVGARSSQFSCLRRNG